MADKDRIEGEGSYSGTKAYNERTKKFMDAGKVEKPKSEQEAHELQEAEQVGKQHARGEDPALRDPKQVPHEGHKHKPKP